MLTPQIPMVLTVDFCCFWNVLRCRSTEKSSCPAVQKADAKEHCSHPLSVPPSKLLSWKVSTSGGSILSWEIRASWHQETNNCVHVCTHMERDGNIYVCVTCKSHNSSSQQREDNKHYFHIHMISYSYLYILQLTKVMTQWDRYIFIIVIYPQCLGINI